jgi:tetratricopeptide (TPR) repeat protein
VLGGTVDCVVVSRSDERSPGSLPFVGRTGELARLHAWWREREANDEADLMVVCGEPGVGKTRLASQFAGELRQSNTIVLTGSATDHRFLPYEPWVKALRSLLETGPSHLRVLATDGHEDELGGIPWLHDVVEGAPSVPVGVPDESAVAAAVEGVLERLASEQPVVVMIDDIHWADTASVRLLERVATSSLRGCGFVVVERRPTTIRRAWSQLDSNRLTRTEVLVGRFDREVCGALVRGGAMTFMPDEFVDAVHDVSGGNAFVVESLLELARQSPMLGETLLSVLPQTAAAIWSDRFSALPSDVLDTLAVAAVIGTTFEISTLVTATSNPAAALESIEIARSFALIEPTMADGEVWRFTHALLREHLHDRLTVTRRRRLHRAVATTLERLADDGPSDRSAQLAYHWRESGPAGQWPMLHHTIDAARWAFLQGAPGTTKRLGGVASNLIGDLAIDDTRSAELMVLRVELGDVLLRVGDGTGVGLMQSAADYYDELGDIDAFARIADALLRAGKSLGQRDAGTRLAEQLVDRLDAVDPRLHSRVLARLARVMEGRVGADEFIAGISSTALKLAREGGDPATLAIALYCCSSQAPWTDDRLERARELIVLGERERNLEYSILGRHMMCTQLIDRGDIAEAALVLDELCELARRAPRGYAGAIRNADLARVAQLSVLNQRAVRAQLLGNFDEQAELIEQLQGFTVDSDVERDRVSSVAFAQTGILAFDRGDLARYVDLAVAFAEEQPETTQRQVNAAFVLAWTGHTDDAWRFYRPIVDADVRTITVEQSMGFMLCLLSWAASLLDDAHGASSIEQRLLPFAGRNTCYFGGSMGPADFGLGHCALARGDRDVALARFGAAIEQCDRWGARPAGARARLAHSSLLVDKGDLGAARSEVDAALATATVLGMPEVASAARAMVDRLDARLPP